VVIIYRLRRWKLVAGVQSLQSALRMPPLSWCIVFRFTYKICSPFVLSLLHASRFSRFSYQIPPAHTACRKVGRSTASCPKSLELLPKVFCNNVYRWTMSWELYEHVEGVTSGTADIQTNVQWHTATVKLLHFKTMAVWWVNCVWSYTYLSTHTHTHTHTHRNTGIVWVAPRDSTIFVDFRCDILSPYT
jgi:hypothetical protein